jgi:hypothetical protein
MGVTIGWIVQGDAFIGAANQDVRLKKSFIRKFDESG